MTFGRVSLVIFKIQFKKFCTHRSLSPTLYTPFQCTLPRTFTYRACPCGVHCLSFKALPAEIPTRNQRRSSRLPNPQLGGEARPTLGAQVSLKLLFGYVTIFSSADLFTTDLNCRKKLACDIISECNVILSRRI